MKTIVLSLGGSIIVPDKIDINFLKNFKKLINEFVKKDYRFAIYCGGGKIARQYQKAASSIGKLTEEDLDWIGIHATRLNAHLLRTIFKGMAEPKVVKNPTKKIKFNKKILIAAGWKPGWSTDYDAILLAKNLGVAEVINITNIDYVYSKDPNKFKDAKPIKEISWKKFRELVGSVWKAGLCVPFDPIAAKEAEKLKLKVIILGKNLKNLRNFLNNKKFRGTIIKYVRNF